MAISAATVGFCVLAGCLVGLPARCAWAAQAGAPAVVRSVADTAMRFDLPRQSLAAALERYGQATGLPVFFDAALVQGRWSSPVAGSYTPREALGRMLASTGLHSQSAGAGQREAFVILPDPSSRGTAPRRQVRPPRRGWFSGATTAWPRPVSGKPSVPILAWRGETIAPPCSSASTRRDASSKPGCCIRPVTGGAMPRSSRRCMASGWIDRRRRTWSSPSPW